MSRFFGNIQQGGPTKTFIYKDGVMSGSFAVSQISGGGGELHTISFESDHIAIGRIASTGGFATITLTSTESYLVPAGEQFGIVYDDLITTTGNVVDIVEKLDSMANPKLTITSPADTSVDVDVLGGTTSGSDETADMVFVLRSNNAAFNMKIREIYYQ